MSSWITGAIAVAGIGANLYGANKQSKDNAAATAANKAALDETNRLEWAKYLMSRGIDPGMATTPGVIPTGAKAMNTKLPVWATTRRRVTTAPAVRGGAVDANGRSWGALGL